MKKAILSIALMMISAQAAFAQVERTAYKNTERNKSAIGFDYPEILVHIRDLVYFKNYDAMLLELGSVEDFDRLKDLDILITKFSNDIQFYRDSLSGVGAGNVRIDYSIWIDSSMHGLDDRAEIRFKKYTPNGDVYFNKKGEVSKLKMDQDTVNLIIRLSPPARYVKDKQPTTRYGLAMQVSFFLNDYTDINKIAEDKELLNHILDTLKSTKKTSTVNNPWKFPSTTIYRPFSKNSGGRFERYNGLVKRANLGKSPYLMNDDLIKPSDKVTLTLNMGMGLIRNTFTPSADMAISIYNMRPSFHTRNLQEQEINTYASIGMSPYFFFDRNIEGNFFVKDNWFANFEIGGASHFMGASTPLLTGGIGYLAIRKGDYFKGTTMKAYMSVKLKNSFTICPEIIFTENFHQIFPGFTIKFF